jgi:polysaccharide biosynthesis transport protein
MDTIDRSNTNLPAPFQANLPALQQDLTPALPLPADHTGTPALQISPRVLLRGLTRYRWLILALWLGVSAPMAFVIYLFVQPTYTASSLLRIDPAQPDLFSPLRRGISEEYNSIYLNTQVGLIKTDKVLEPAVADPLVVNLPSIKQSPDPKNDLVAKLRVGTVDNTNLIRVSLELANRDEAVTIVQAVVRSYLTQNIDYSRSANRELTESLKQQLEKIGVEITRTREKLKGLYKKGKITVLKPEDRLNNNKVDADVTQPTFKTYSENRFERMMDEMAQTDLQLIEAQSTLEVMRETYNAMLEASQQSRQEGNEQQLAHIREEFNKDPEVLALKQEFDKMRAHLDRIKKNVRQPHDPARVAAQNQFDKLQEEYRVLWEEKYPEILKRLAAPVQHKDSLARIQELVQKVDALKKKKEKEIELFKVMEVDQKLTNDDTFEATYLNHQVSSLLSGEEQVKKNLEQLKWEAGQDKYRVTLYDSASASRTPSNNKRLKYMAAAPVGVMFMMLGLFLLLEIKSERVADPDSLSTRVRSEVYALPPLHTGRSLRKLRESDADDQLEQFKQRLDHLRFAVCGTQAALGQGRCVLITSAVGGEGKTTLAAQLAARCGDAGMSTVLIDSDFHRAGLCKLLRVPEGPGLSDVLTDKAAIDDVVIPIQAGTFYLLPAGIPIPDTSPSRLLQSPEFGQLMSYLRQRYELIIIDSPPVLPVPDALILGRWADGAVIAARYDVSRFPQVERARRQLDNAGIAVLGTVINGMRSSDSYYGGSYTYGRRRSNQPDSSDTI